MRRQNVGSPAVLFYSFWRRGPSECLCNTPPPTRRPPRLASRAPSKKRSALYHTAQGYTSAKAPLRSCGCLSLTSANASAPKLRFWLAFFRHLPRSLLLMGQPQQMLRRGSARGGLVPRKGHPTRGYPLHGFKGKGGAPPCN